MWRPNNSGYAVVHTAVWWYERISCSRRCILCWHRGRGFARSCKAPSAVELQALGHGCSNRAFDELQFLFQYTDSCTMKVFGKIVAEEKSYSNKSKRCNLCLTKKVLIITADRGTPLHKRSELISTYGHSRKFMLLYSKKFSSAKNFVKSNRPVVRQEFIFVKRRSSLVALRSFGRCFVAYRWFSHSWIFLIPHL